MMPRLKAAEAVDAVNVERLGSDNMDSAVRMRAIGNLQRQMLGDRYRAKKATARDLGGMGIGVRVTPRAEPSENGLSDG